MNRWLKVQILSGVPLKKMNITTKDAILAGIRANKAFQEFKEIEPDITLETYLDLTMEGDRLKDLVILYFISKQDTEFVKSVLDYSGGYVH